MAESAALLNFADGHMIPETVCAPSVTGSPNVDGRCVLGGRVCGQKCDGTPIFVVDMVPYVINGTVSGTNWEALAHLRQSARVRQPPLAQRRP